MDISKLVKNMITLISKYKYPLIILLVGVFLMLFPKRTDVSSPNIEATTQQEVSIEQQLSEILSQVKGAGKVEVMLTIREGEEILYQMDTNISQGESSGNQTHDTVIISDKNRSQSGLIRQIYSPKYQGAIILCTGADDPNIRLAIVDAVSKITGLGADKISVLELK